MNLQNIKKLLEKEFPHIILEFEKEENTMIFKNIIYAKRFDMGYSWNVHVKLSDDKIIKKIYKCRTYDNVRADFEKELNPTKEVEKEFKKIINLLQIEENLL